MAGNKTIFDLPLRTGVTADDRLAIVDSGNTLTSSVKVSDLRDGTGVNTLETLTGDISFSGTNIDISTNGQTIHLSGSTGGGGGGATFFSADTTDTSNIVQIDRGHSITYGTGAIQENFFLGGNGNEIDASIGTAQPYYRNVLIGGNNNRLYPDFSNAGWSSNNTAIIAGNGNRMGRQSDDSVIFGGSSNYVGYGNDNGIFAGISANVTGGRSVSIGGSSAQVNGNDASNLGGVQNKARANYSSSVGGYQSQVEINSNYSVIVGGQSNYIGAGGFTHSGIFAGNNNEVQHDRSVVIGGQNLTSNTDDEVLVPNLTIANYASLNFADDSAAATGGVPLGGLYHTSGAVKVRTT